MQKKIPYGDLDFLKNGYKSIGSSVGKILSFFFSRAKRARLSREAASAEVVQRKSYSSSFTSLAVSTPFFLAPAPIGAGREVK